MGISNIVLINPCPFLVEETFKMGWGAEDVIRSLKVHPSLPEFLKDFHVVIGTTQRKRSYQVPLYSPRTLYKQLLPKLDNHRVAILFGREDNGLTHEELRLCHIHSSVAKKVRYPSLNLSQAVMIYGYEYFQAANRHAEPYHWKLATKSEEELMYQKLEELIPSLPFKARGSNQQFADLFRRVLGRTQLESRDVRLFLKLWGLLLR